MTKGSPATRAPRRKPAPERTPIRRCLLIGNGKVRASGGHGYALQIAGIDKDLESLGAVLGDAEFGGFEVVRLMAPKLIDARREIARAARGLEATDTLVIYYSGTSTRGNDGLLYLPVSDSDVDFLEATCLDSDYVLSCMRACGSRHQVLIMDGCHAGAFFASNRGIPDGFCAIIACGPDEYSYGDAAGGFFTRLLVEGLRGARADGDGNGIVTTDELFEYVRQRVEAQADALQPSPQLWRWNLPQPIPLVTVRLRVFVSYRRADTASADALLARLEAEGYGVWLDRSDIAGGKRWRMAIEQALVECDAVVFLISKASLESDEVYKELARAVDLGKAIVPLRLDDSALYGWFNDKLGALQHITFDADDKAQPWWPRLVAALRQARKAVRGSAR